MDSQTPGGAMVCVTSRTPDGVRFLFLHNAEHPVGVDGDWAWGPPSGCREPGEAIGDCAARELREESGIEATPVPVRTEGVFWAVYRLEVPWPCPVTLDPAEHNAFAWFDRDQARQRSRPDALAESFALATEAIDSISQRT